VLSIIGSDHENIMGARGATAVDIQKCLGAYANLFIIYVSFIWLINHDKIYY